MPNPATIKIAPNVIQVSINSTWILNSNISTIQYWLFDQAPSGADCSAVAGLAVKAWQDHMNDLLHADLTVQDAHWMLMSNENSPTGTVVRDDTAPPSGSKVGAALPSNVALLIHKVLATSSRSARNGRMYLVGIEEASVDGEGDISEPAHVAAQAAIDIYFTNARTLASTVGGAKMCVPHWSKTNRPTPEQGGLWPSTSVSEVASLRLDPKVATQRRRLR